MQKMNFDKIKLCESKDCTGCFACEAVCPKVAIHRVKNDEGFEYPEVDESLCVSCHACQQSCPVLSPEAKHMKGIIYAAWNKDESIRCQSSSGGMFSVFAEQILSEGGVVVGAAMAEDDYVRHIVVCKKEEMASLRGSKYVQSLIERKLYANLRTFLQGGKKVLFCGTPCQVSAIRKVFKRYEQQLFLLDLVCHGVPSPTFFSLYLKRLKKRMPNLVSYQFRDFKQWEVCSSVNVNVNGNIYNHRLYGESTFYQDAFLKGYMHRECCYHCVYASVERVGDITLADFWGIGKSKPIDENYKGGCSMVSVNSNQGQELLKLVSDRVFIEKRDIQETIDGGNKQLVEPSSRPRERDSFYKDAYRLSYKKLISKYNLKLIQKVTFPRMLKREIVKMIKRFK